MALDRQDGDDLCEEESPLLTTIGIRYIDGLMVLTMRKLPEYVTLDRNLRVESTCSDVFSDELALKMRCNEVHINPNVHYNLEFTWTWGFHGARFLSIFVARKKYLSFKEKKNVQKVKKIINS